VSADGKVGVACRESKVVHVFDRDFTKLVSVPLGDGQPIGLESILRISISAEKFSDKL
jgi:hypothetical protein